jgi:hypothetical protein
MFHSLADDWSACVFAVSALFRRPTGPEGLVLKHMQACSKGVQFPDNFGDVRAPRADKVTVQGAQVAHAPWPLLLLWLSIRLKSSVWTGSIVGSVICAFVPDPNSI